MKLFTKALKLQSIKLFPFFYNFGLFVNFHSLVFSNVLCQHIKVFLLMVKIEIEREREKNHTKVIKR